MLKYNSVFLEKRIDVQYNLINLCQYPNREGLFTGAGTGIYPGAANGRIWHSGQNIRVIEQALSVSIRARNAHIEITGESADDVKNAADVLNHLKILYDNKEEITIDVVYRVLESVQNGEIYETLSAMSDIVVIAHSNRPIKCKTIGQKIISKPFKKIRSHSVLDPLVPGKLILPSPRLWQT